MLGYSQSLVMVVISYFTRNFLSTINCLREGRPFFFFLGVCGGNREGRHDFTSKAIVQYSSKKMLITDQ